jgi:exodeoxyribonuclease III
MRLISYNVNGIRAAFTKAFTSWVEASQPDVLCLQESKAQPEQIDVLAFEALGYQSFWHSAQKKGYSGVGIVCKQTPKHVEYGCGIAHIDAEGRIIRADFEGYSVMSVYVPSASNIERLEFKMQFCYDFLSYIKQLQQSIPNLIICGDFNICHQAIDIHNPKSLQTTSGFLPIEREWLSQFLHQAQMLDSFRALNPNVADAYSWWSYRANARNNNKGWRIDYNFVSQTLATKITRACILPEAKHSDHCPVLVELDV